jgi:uncharacterized membrane protein
MQAEQPETGIDDFIGLRAYVQTLNLRVQVLERQVASLKGEHAAGPVADKPNTEGASADAGPVIPPRSEEPVSEAASIAEPPTPPKTIAADQPAATSVPAQCPLLPLEFVFLFQFSSPTLSFLVFWVLLTPF